jgi:copper chaperone CopZ
MAQSQSGHESRKPDTVIEQPDVVMHVSGLACGLCAHSVTNALQKVDAVEDIQVLLEDDQRILLTLKEGAKVDEKTLREAVTSAGFEARKVVFKDTPGAST